VIFVVSGVMNAREVAFLNAKVLICGRRQTPLKFASTRARADMLDGVLSRVVGFDNEHGKGDHLHRNGIERPYKFQSVQQLVEDFIAAIDT
jgi:hypothetical protein